MAAVSTTIVLDAADLLGGKRALGRQEEQAHLQRAIRAGLPYAALEALERRLKLTHRDVLFVLGTAPRTLARRKRERRLSPLESDRLYRLARVGQRAAATLGTLARARTWLGRPNRALGGKTPLSMLDTEIGTQQVEESLARINHGMYAQMRLWRLARRAFAKQPLSGKGGLFASGRWHNAPRLVIYASQSLALATLEVLVHVDVDLFPDDLVAIEIDVPAAVAVATWTAVGLPRSWRRYPAPPVLQRRGDAWLDALAGAVLAVPSAVVPSEYNYLINPLHEDARHITVVGKRLFALDPRLLRLEEE